MGLQRDTTEWLSLTYSLNDYEGLDMELFHQDPGHHRHCLKTHHIVLILLVYLLLLDYDQHSGLKERVKKQTHLSWNTVWCFSFIQFKWMSVH